MKTPSICLFIAALFCGCTSPQIYTSQEAFTGDTKNEVVKNQIGSEFSDPIWQVNPMRITNKSGSSRLVLQIIYRSPTWLFISEGKSLIFSADGQKFVLNGPGSIGNRTVAGGRTIETAYYDITWYELRTLGACHEVVMRVYGAQGYCDTKLKPKNIRAIHAFAGLFDEQFPPPNL